MNFNKKILLHHFSMPCKYILCDFVSQKTKLFKVQTSEIVSDAKLNQIKWYEITFKLKLKVEWFFTEVQWAYSHLGKM